MLSAIFDLFPMPTNNRTLNAATISRRPTLTPASAYLLVPDQAQVHNSGVGFRLFIGSHCGRITAPNSTSPFRASGQPHVQVREALEIRHIRLEHIGRHLRSPAVVNLVVIGQ